MRPSAQFTQKNCQLRASVAHHRVGRGLESDDPPAMGDRDVEIQLIWIDMVVSDGE